MNIFLLLVAFATFNSFALNSKVDGIYGPDNRLEYYQAKSEHQSLADKTAAMIDKRYVSGEYLSTNVFTLKEALEDEFKVKACSDTKFLNQPSYANCSGSLIAPDMILTAGHCITSQEDCENYYWIFNYKMPTGTSSFNRYVPTSKVFSCKKIITRDLNKEAGLDYAIIQLNRSTDKDGINYRWAEQIESNTGVLTIGTPYGLPLKVTTDAIVRNNSYSNFFLTNLDTFAGNSGSPVFNATNLQIEGILVRGDTDYAIDSSRKCVTENKCTDYGCRGESVSRMTSIPEVKAMGQLFNLIQKKASQSEMEAVYPVKFWADFPMPDANTLLHYAVAYESLDAVSFLLKKGSNINVKSRWGYTPVFSITNNKEMLKLLIKSGADIEMKLPNGETPILNFARTGRHEQLKLMIQMGANYRVADNDGNTIYKWYANKPEQFKELVALGLKDPSATPATTSDRYTILGKLFTAGIAPSASTFQDKAYKGRCYYAEEPDQPTGSYLYIKKWSDGTFGMDFLTGTVDEFDNRSTSDIISSYVLSTPTAQISGNMALANIRGAPFKLRTMGNLIITERIKETSVDSRCYFFLVDGLEHL